MRMTGHAHQLQRDFERERDAFNEQTRLREVATEQKLQELSEQLKDARQERQLLLAAVKEHERKARLPAAHHLSKSRCVESMDTLSCGPSSQMAGEKVLNSSKSSGKQGSTHSYKKRLSQMATLTQQLMDDDL